MWLGEDRAHYYVLSRFLVSRSLTVTKIPHMKAVKIALELKKYCVDNDMLDISQVRSILSGRHFIQADLRGQSAHGVCGATAGRMLQSRRAALKQSRCLDSVEIIHNMRR